MGWDQLRQSSMLRCAPLQQDEAFSPASGYGVRLEGGMLLLEPADASCVMAGTQKKKTEGPPECFPGGAAEGGGQAAERDRANGSTS